ncbi:hypothetical protein HDV01_003017 [Terramyces sp. JEL0728]|nr:hypothetical protein HDV01_003017 [Terramyces sp. JEL0728]
MKPSNFGKSTILPIHHHQGTIEISNDQSILLIGEYKRTKYRVSIPQERITGIEIGSESVFDLELDASDAYFDQRMELEKYTPIVLHYLDDDKDTTVYMCVGYETDSKTNKNEEFLKLVNPIANSNDRDNAIQAQIEQLKKEGYTFDEILVLSESQFLIPGLVDTHIHGPQYVFTGTGYDLTLLKWLETYTFPKEAEFRSVDHASSVYSRVVGKSLRSGTTAACYYATIHKEGSIALAETCAKYGQRAFIGKVNMDRNSPEYYIESTAESIHETEKFVKHIVENIASPLITPCITPRFVPSCSSELMNSLGEIAKKYSLPIQSHISENVGEIAWVKELHPDCTSYSHVYDKYNLMTSKTVMAHCVHLTAEERRLFKEKGVGISHCPNSNFCLHSGVLNVRRLIQEGFEKIGLGTDVAGGYSPSIMDAMRQALISSKVVHIDSHAGEDTKYEALNFANVFYLATLGGAKVMNLDAKIGNFLVGKDFDALVVDINSSMGKPFFNRENVHSTLVDQFDHDDHLSLFEKFIYLGDDRSFSRMYIAGKRIF